jgi:hypothetical protein
MGGWNDSRQERGGNVRSRIIDIDPRAQAKAPETDPNTPGTPAWSATAKKKEIRENWMS